MLSRPLLECATCVHRSQRVFCNLDKTALAHYAMIGLEVNFARGVTLFAEGDRSTGVFILCTGQVKLFCTSKGGKTLILKIAMPGEVLGLGAVISGTSYEVTAETIEPTQVKRIPRDAFLAFIDTFGEGSLHTARALSEDYKAAFFNARRLALSGSAAGRLAGVLLDWGEAAGSCGSYQRQFTMALTHEELANLVGTSRETVTRTLTRFKKDSLIQIKGSSFLITAPKRLEQLFA